MVNLHNLSERVIELWNGWEVRVMILLSLLLQIFLTVTGSRRKYATGFWSGTCVWLAYLSADWVATLTLGVLARSQGAGSESNGTASTSSNASIIPAFWEPMLLVHLGGPETITAYALEDNELWQRHLLQLLTQLAVAFYATLRSWWSKDPLIYLVIPIFVCGMVKYGERIWVLWCASSNQLRKSVSEERDKLDDMSTDQFYEFFRSNKMFTVPDLQRNKYLHEAHFLFPNLKISFADYYLTFRQHMSSYVILRLKSSTEAFRLIEVELGFMFDILFTKMMTSVCWRTRFILRFINFLSSVSALLAFSLITSRRNFNAYSENDMIISYLLLVGAVVLEIYSAILTLFSDWVMLWISKQIRESWADRLLSLVKRNKRWKASVPQHQLSIGSPQPGRICILINKMLSRLYSWEVVGDDLKKLIFDHLLDKRKGYDAHQMDEEDLKNILEQRGGGVLKKKDCLEVGWSVSGERDFHESLLIWHLAIDTYFEKSSDDDSNKYCKMSKSLCRYMMYLWKELPFMLPKELGEGKYELSSFKDSLRDQARTLSTSLTTELETRKKHNWEMISEVLVEMLCYAASHCEWKAHAKALAHGGELLTFLALLMAHLGFSQQCRYPPKTDQDRALQEKRIVDFVEEKEKEIRDLDKLAQDFMDRRRARIPMAICIVQIKLLRSPNIAFKFLLWFPMLF